MRGFIITLFILFLIDSPIEAKEFFENYTASNGRNIFVYHIPEDDTSQQEDKAKLEEDKVSDDVTADTTKPYTKDDYIEYYDTENYDLENSYDDIGDMYGYVLKGYAQYNEEDEDGIALDITENEKPVLAIKKPQKITSEYFTGVKSSASLYDNIYTKFDGTEYSIAPLSATTSRSFGGGFSAGTTYSQGIDYGELEQSSGIFSKYQYKNFAISTSYAKTVNSTNNTYNDNFYIIPEVKLNQYFTLKNIFSADTVKKRKKAEVILSLNPFGNKDYDRMRLEFGASETYDDMNNLMKSQFKFSTNFKF